MALNTPEHQQPWRRFHIMGGAGSGKTTLARQLSTRLGYPCYELDWIGWSREGKRPLDARLADIERIVAQPAWITEGAFLWWTDKLLEHADVIVWLDLPFRINAWRMVKRHMTLSLAGTNPHPGVLNLFKFMRGVHQRYKAKIPITPQAPDDDFAITRIATAEILVGYPDKLVHCRSPQDVKRFHNYVTSGRPSNHLTTRLIDL